MKEEKNNKPSMCSRYLNLQLRVDRQYISRNERLCADNAKIEGTVCRIYSCFARGLQATIAQSVSYFSTRYYWCVYAAMAGVTHKMRINRAGSSSFRRIFSKIIAAGLATYAMIERVLVSTLYTQLHYELSSRTASLFLEIRVYDDGQ